MELPKISNQIAAGMLAGLISGVVMTLFLSINYWLNDFSPLTPLQLLSATYLGDAALLPSSLVQSLAFGIPVHLAACAVLGGLFSIMFTPENRTVVIPVSLIYGFILGASLYHIFMPMGLNIALVQRMPERLFLISHVIFGAGLMLVIPFFHRIEASYLHSLIATPIRPEKIENPNEAA